MIRAINFCHQPIPKTKQFQEFTFIGKSASNSGSESLEQLHFSPNNHLLSEAELKNSWKITRIHTNKNLIQELKNLGIQPGAIVELLSHGDRGSVVVSCDCKLIGIGGEIARNIVVTLSGSQE